MTSSYNILNMKDRTDSTWPYYPSKIADNSNAFHCGVEWGMTHLKEDNAQAVNVYFLTTHKDMQPMSSSKLHQ